MPLVLLVFLVDRGQLKSETLGRKVNLCCPWHHTPYCCLGSKLYATALNSSLLVPLLLTKYRLGPD